MPLFRFHRGGLDESLATTVIVSNADNLMSVIRDSWRGWSDSNRTFKIKIEPYPSKESCFDKRIGWFTQIVTTDILVKDEFLPIGFLSEALGINNE